MAPRDGMTRRKKVAHILDLEDMVSIIPALKAYVLWWMDKLQDSSREILLSELAFCCDPLPIFLQMRETVWLSSRSLQLEIASYTNHVTLAVSKRPFKRIDVKASWVENPTGVGRLLTSKITSLEITALNPFVQMKREVTGKLKEPAVVHEEGEPNLPHPLQIAVWNARGIARPGFKAMVNQLYNDHSPDVLLISETRVPACNAREIIHDLPYNGFHQATPEGLTGGILLLYKSDKLCFSSITKKVHSLHGYIKLAVYRRNLYHGCHGSKVLGVNSNKRFKQVLKHHEASGN